MPSSANGAPSYCACAAAPFSSPPPWIQTMTGASRWTVVGVQTFRNRQSSLCGMLAVTPMPGFCGHTAPNRLASRTPVQCGAGAGGRQRRGPMGAAAYGIPR